MSAQSCAIGTGKRLLGAVIAGWLSPVWLWASEGAEAEVSVSPFAGDISTSIFTLVVFLILLGILWKFAWTPILTNLKRREDFIRQSVEDAEKAQRAVHEAQEAYQKQMAEARRESRDLIEKGRQEALQLAEQMKNEAQEQAKQLRQQAQSDIEQARQSAVRDIYNQSANLAAELAGKIIHRTLSPEDHRALLHESLAQLQKKSGDN